MRVSAVLLGAALLVAAWAAPLPAAANSSTDNAAPFNLNQNLRFRLVYPRFLRFRVGTDAAGAIDLITFTVPAASVGNATPLAGAGGDAGGSAANISVLGNAGQVTITPTNNSGGLGLGTGVVADGRINYNQLATSSSSAQLPAPVLSNAGGAAVMPALNSAQVTQRSAVWTYSYLNATIPSAGTYGTSANGGRVTYTATMP